MEKEQIAETVQECGERAESHQWMQAKMLGEIAYQLAVMNERETGHVKPYCLECIALELAGSPIAPAGSFVNVPCMFPPGHLGDHSWENLKHEHDNIRKPFQCHDCGGYVVGGGCTCSPEVKRKRWEDAVPTEQRGTGNKIL